MTLHEYQDELSRIEEMYECNLIDYDTYKSMIQELYEAHG